MQGRNIRRSECFYANRYGAGLGHDVWLVAGRGYRPYNGRCTTLVADLTALRPAASTVVMARPIHYFEHATLYRFGG